MGSRVVLNVQHIRQPPNECGSTALLQVLAYYGRSATLHQITHEAKSPQKMGDWDYKLGTFALKRGLNVTIFDNNLHIYDPTWFSLPPQEIAKKVRERFDFVKRSNERDVAGNAWLLPALAAAEDFIQMGGAIDFSPLSRELIVRHLRKGIPLICSPSIEYLYNTPRCYKNKADDIRGISYGHFITIVGYKEKEFIILDPEKKGIFSSTLKINADLLINAILRRRDGTVIAIDKPEFKTRATKLAYFREFLLSP